MRRSPLSRRPQLQVYRLCRLEGPRKLPHCGEAGALRAGGWAGGRVGGWAVGGGGWTGRQADGGVRGRVSCFFAWLLACWVASRSHLVLHPGGAADLARLAVGKSDGAGQEALRGLVGGRGDGRVEGGGVGAKRGHGCGVRRSVSLGSPNGHGQHQVGAKVCSTPTPDQFQSCHAICKCQDSRWCSTKGRTWSRGSNRRWG